MEIAGIEKITAVFLFKNNLLIECDKEYIFFVTDDYETIESLKDGVVTATKMYSNDIGEYEGTVSLKVVDSSLNIHTDIYELGLRYVETVDLEELQFDTKRFLENAYNMSHFKDMTALIGRVRE